ESSTEDASSQRPFLVITDPNATGQLGDKSNKPGVGGIIGSTGLSGNGPAQLLGSGGRTKLNNTLKHVDHLIGDLRAQDFIMDKGAVLLQKHAVRVFYSFNEKGFGTNAMVRKCREGRHHFLKSHFDRTKGQRKVRLKVTIDSESTGDISNLLRSNGVCQANRGDITRSG